MARLTVIAVDRGLDSTGMAAGTLPITYQGCTMGVTVYRMAGIDEIGI